MNPATATPGLRELQRWFASATTHPDGVPQDKDRSQQLERLLTRGPQLSAAERLQIYCDGYFARLVECLTDDYPALAYALGDDTFADLCRAYIAAHPSRSPSLNAYGSQMASYCQSRTEPWAAFATDLARLEWALVEVVHEPAVTALTPQALAAVPAARLQSARLLASPAVRLLACDYPVNDFYRAFREGTEPTLPEPAPTAVVVYRDGLSLWRQNLEPRAAWLLGDLLIGVPLEVAVASLERRVAGTGAERELPTLLPAWLGAWVQNGLFCGIEPAAAGAD